MADYDKAQKPATPDKAKEQTTQKYPHGGGNKYFQSSLGKGFAVHDPIPGHTQKLNTKPLKKSKTRAQPGPKS